MHRKWSAKTSYVCMGDHKWNFNISLISMMIHRPQLIIYILYIVEYRNKTRSCSVKTIVRLALTPLTHHPYYLG